MSLLLSSAIICCIHRIAGSNEQYSADYCLCMNWYGFGLTVISVNKKGILLCCFDSIPRFPGFGSELVSAHCVQCAEADTGTALAAFCCTVAAELSFWEPLRPCK